MLHELKKRIQEFLLESKLNQIMGKKRNTYLFASLSVLPVLVTQNRLSTFLSLDTLGFLERLPNCTSADLAVFIESIVSKRRHGGS